MTNDDILPMIKNAAATYNLIGKYTVNFSGAGDSFSEFDSATVYCISCNVEADYSHIGLYSSSKTPVPHKRKCPCSKDEALAAEFVQQATDVIAGSSMVTTSTIASSVRTAWEKDDLLFQILDFDGRADFNNDGSSGHIIINFENLTIEIDVSVNEMISSDLGTNTYDSSTFDSEAAASPKVDKVDIDALGDFKEWLGPAT